MKLPRWLPTLLGFLIAVGPVSTDVYLPALPAIEAGFGAPPGAAQLTLATWFAGLAIGQITQGTLSDRFGRKRPLFAGIALYTVCSVGCALSTSLAAMSTFRFFGAIGGSAGMVIPRAMVRDMHDGAAAVRVMGRLMLVMGVTPILAPTLGGFVLNFTSWRSIFWLAALYGVVCLVLIRTRLPDTLLPSRRVRLSFAGLVARYLGILRERSFITHSVVNGFSTFGMFAYLSGSPAVFIDIYKLSPAHYGMLFGTNAFFYIAGSQLNSRVVARIGLSRTLTAGSAAYLVTTAIECVAAWSRVDSFLFTLLPMTAMWASLGFVQPNATVGALSRHSGHAASAAALMGMLQYVLGAVAGLLMAVLSDGTTRPLASMLLLGALGCAALNWMRPSPWREATP